MRQMLADLPLTRRANFLISLSKDRGRIESKTLPNKLLCNMTIMENTLEPGCASFLMEGAR